MNGNELLWPGGTPRGGLDISLAAEDLELTRLCALLFPGFQGEEALQFASPYLTDDPETILLRQKTVSDLMRNPGLLDAFRRLRELLDELEVCDKGVQDNAMGLRVTRMDAAMDGVKKVVMKLEKNLSKQGADILEESASDNRYAQLLRLTHFRRRLTALYVEAVTLLRDSLKGISPESTALAELGRWAAQCYETDKVADTAAVLKKLDEEWKGVGAFSVDVCLDGRRMVVGLEMAEVRETPFAQPGMLEGAGSENPHEGITSLLSFPQNGNAVLFQEYLLSEVGYEVRGKLTKLREALVRLPVTGGTELLTLRDALRFYTGAADFACRLRDRGSAVCAPRLLKSGTLEFTVARLPEQTCTGSLPVPNDLYLESGGSILMTGPNSSGKTCCLIMAGQFLFLGQLGCLLPAEEAAFAPRDRLLTLFAAGESETGEDSRMGLEVQRLKLLRERMTEKSIFLLNEPMTSTSAEEGGQICVDLLADLAQKNVPSILVTHFNHIWPALEAKFDTIGRADRLHSLVMTVEEKPNGVEYLYRLKAAPPPPSSHARAVIAAKGVTLENMLRVLGEKGVDMRPDADAWTRLRQGTVWEVKA